MLNTCCESIGQNIRVELASKKDAKGDLQDLYKVCMQCAVQSKSVSFDTVTSVHVSKGVGM